MAEDCDECVLQQPLLTFNKCVHVDPFGNESNDSSFFIRVDCDGTVD